MKPKLYPTQKIENDEGIEYIALSYSGSRILYGYSYNKDGKLVAHDISSNGVHTFMPSGKLDTELQRDRILFTNVKTTKSKKKIKKLLMIRELLR